MRPGCLQKHTMFDIQLHEKVKFISCSCICTSWMSAHHGHPSTQRPQRSQGWLWCLKQWRAPGVISPRLGAPLSSTPESLPCTVQSVPTQVTQPWVWIQGVSFLDCLRENSLIFTSLCKRAKIYLSYWFVLRVEKKKYYEAFNMFVVHHNT